MTIFVALLRAVNVGGTGKLPMSELRTMCETAGFSNPRTYIASGNVVFESRANESKVKAQLEQALEAYAGKPVGVIIRSGAEMAAVLAANPFSAEAPSRTVAIFLDRPPAADALATVSGLPMAATIRARTPAPPAPPSASLLITDAAFSIKRSLSASDSTREVIIATGIRLNSADIFSCSSTS